MRIIQGEARGRRLLSPPGKATRPPLDRIRESVFAVLASGFEGGRVLDLFAGSGAFGLEALSRGARSALFVEKSPAALAALRRNIENLGFGPRCEVRRGNALEVPNLSVVQRRVTPGQEPRLSLHDTAPAKLPLAGVPETSRLEPSSKPDPPPPWSLVFLDPPFTMFPAGGEGEDASAVIARVEEILASPQILPGGVVVLRLPSEFPWKRESSPRERKVYGESTVLFFAR